MPLRSPGKPFLLYDAQHRTGLDQVQAERRRKAGRCPADGAAGIRGERAATRSQLHEIDRRRRAHGRPHASAPDADQLAEHLGDLRRGEEIAARAQRVTGHVVAVTRMSETEPHVTVHGQRSLGGDQFGQHGLKRAHGAT
jgi:hypothetical protein